MVTASAPLGRTTADAPAGGSKPTAWAVPDHIAGIAVSAYSLLEAMPDGVVIVDGLGVIRAVNGVAESMFGYERAHLVGRPVQDLVPVLARAVQPARVQQYLAHATGNPMGDGMELSGLHKDGREFPIDVSLAPLETPQGRFVCASVRDVTYSRLAAIVDSSTDAIIGARLDGTVTSWNAGAEHLYGYGAAEMVGHDHSAITPAGLGGELPAALQCIREGGRVAHYVTQRLHKDGSSLDVSITVSPVRNRSGVVIGVSTVARDVTDDMRNQAELAHQSELFLSAAGELRVALARAEQSETSYRVLLDQLPDMATFTYGSDYRVSAVSGSWFLPEDVDLSGLTGKTLDEVFERDGASLMRGYLGAAFAGRTVDDEIRVNSAELTCHIHASLLPALPGDASAKVLVVLRDISAGKKREGLLARSEERWRAVFDAAPVGIVEFDIHGKVVAANRALGALLEIPADELVGNIITSYIHPDETAAWERRLKDLGRRRAAEVVERRLVTAKGNRRWTRAQATLVVAGHESQPDRILAYWVDSTAEHLVSERLARTSARFAALLERNADAIVVQDSVGGRVDYASPGLFAMLGLTPDAAVGSDLEHLIHPDDLAKAHERFSALNAGMGASVSFDGRLRHTDGGWRNVETTTTNLIADPAVGGVISNLHDVTDRVEAAKLLAHQAMHDTLTELPNRALLLDRLDQALARAARSGRPCALLFIDLDHFKRVNDTLGHAAGDQLLKTVASRLLHAIRPGDSVGRLGGDEFVVLAENIDEPATVFAIAERVRAGIAEPVMVADKAVTVSGSVGIALSNQHTPTALFQEADMALHRSKQSGRNRTEIYDRAMRTQAHQRQEIEDLVRAALSNGTLTVHYQPIVDLRSGAVTGSEALARIRQPDGTMANPGDFIAVAEDSGLIIPLGDAVLDLACAQQARWRAAASARGRMAVNVSARQLGSDSFVSGIERALAAHGLPPEDVCIEITESTLIDIGSSTRGRIGELKDLGVSLALDDFGTGWSSLSYLRQFPFDVVKIDQSFVAGLGTNHGDTQLVKAVIDLAHALDLSTIGEGIETEDQDRLLREMGCTYAQGYLYGRPEPAQ
jgi:diguanylate cyclase (GGDEF)-like protein/PAS domain S-box-containing protein